MGINTLIYVKCLPSQAFKFATPFGLTFDSLSKCWFLYFSSRCHIDSILISSVVQEIVESAKKYV